MPAPQAADMPLEGFTPLMSRLANIEDHLMRLLYATAHADVGSAPASPRPDMPHEARRRELKRAKARQLEMRLIPGGDDA